MAFKLVQQKHSVGHWSAGTQNRALFLNSNKSNKWQPFLIIQEQKFKLKQASWNAKTAWNLITYELSYRPSNFDHDFLTIL